MLVLELGEVEVGERVVGFEGADGEGVFGALEVAAAVQQQVAERGPGGGDGQRVAVLWCCALVHAGELVATCVHVFSLGLDCVYCCVV